MSSQRLRFEELVHVYPLQALGGSIHWWIFLDVQISSTIAKSILRHVATLTGGPSQRIPFLGRRWWEGVRTTLSGNEQKSSNKHNRTFWDLLRAFVF